VSSNRELVIQPKLSTARPLALAGYPIALLLIASSVMDTLPKVLPADFGSRDWRYGALGLTFNSIVTPILGLVIAAAAALIARHRKVLLTVSGVFLALAAFAVIGGLIFVLDYNGLAGGLSERAAAGFRVATWKTALIVLLLIPAAIWFGIGGLRAAGTDGAPDSSGDLIIGRQSS